jgi:HEAT repeat protein
VGGAVPSDPRPADDRDPDDRDTGDQSDDLVFDPTLSLRRREAALAGHRGDAATARAMLADPAAVVRGAALGALARTGDLTDADLSTALADPDAGLRQRAVALAAPRPGPPLLGMLRDPDATVVEVAAWALGERPTPEDGSVEALALLAGGHHDPLVREAAVAALGAIGDPAGLPAILRGLRDRPAVRRRAVLALAPFEGPEVDAALAGAREDRDWQVRQAAEELSAP